MKKKLESLIKFYKGINESFYWWYYLTNSNQLIENQAIVMRPTVCVVTERKQRKIVSLERLELLLLATTAPD